MSVLQSSACFYPLWEIVTPTRSMWESNWGLSLWEKRDIEGIRGEQAIDLTFKPGHHGSGESVPRDRDIDM